MKRLYVRYGDLELFDGDVEEFGFSEGGGQVTVTGRQQKAQSGKGVADLLGALAGAKKQQTAGEVARRRHELDAEKVSDD